MPKVKRSRKPPPDGWELIEPTLDELDQKMREGSFSKLQSIARMLTSRLFICLMIRRNVGVIKH